MKSSPHGKYAPEQERSAYGKKESAAEKGSFRDMARNNITVAAAGAASLPPKEERQGMRHLVIIHTDTTSREAVADYVERWQWDRQRQRRRRQRRWYFFKQRLMGVLLLALTILAVKAADGDATIALITIPLGLYLTFTGKMVITDSFYWGTKGRKRNEQRNSF